MGQTIVNIKIHGPGGTAEVEAIVDTGATFTKIPRSPVEQAGLQPAYEAEVQLADGRIITRQLAAAEVETDGVRRIAPVAIAEDGEHPLVGMPTLQNLGFKVNPVTEALEPALPIGYEHRA